jgi:hypothetical protein
MTYLGLFSFYFEIQFLHFPESIFLRFKMYVKKMLYKFGVFHCNHVVVAMLDIIELLVQT